MVVFTNLKCANAKFILIQSINMYHGIMPENSDVNSNFKYIALSTF